MDNTFQLNHMQTLLHWDLEQRRRLQKIYMLYTRPTKYIKHSKQKPPLSQLYIWFDAGF